MASDRANTAACEIEDAIINAGAIPTKEFGLIDRQRIAVAIEYAINELPIEANVIIKTRPD